MDQKGILMLNSIREIFDIVGISFESMKFFDEIFDNERSIIDAINIQKKCPAIAGAKIDFSTRPVTVDCVHVMVAAGVKSETIGASTQHFIQCKNSYRDQNQPGNFHHKL